ncbi:transcriptional regulator LysR family [Vibrio ponticus]|nr:transcriptional regulator LysR family [Vibrio ponticus]
MKLPPLKCLYSFVAVAETGSMTEAARQLNVSHSAVSQSIKTLESQLGKELFKRVGRNVVLNAVGKKYYRQVAPALETIVNATQSLLSTPLLSALPSTWLTLSPCIGGY